jgi:hypothetical protein
MERNKLLLAVAATLVAACETATGPDSPSALATASNAPTTFSGDATVVQTTVTPLGATTPITINLVETGKLPESGGALETTLLTLNISKQQTAGVLALSAKVGHATTVGQGKHSRAQATVADLSLDVAGNAIEATFLEAIASAACDAAGAATAAGRSTVVDLVINGVTYSVGTQPNQTIVDLPALRVVANEQNQQPGGANDADITVNALHVTVYAIDPLTGQRGAQLADVVIASAHADIRCGLCTDKGDDFTTGGGWFNADDPPHRRKHFAVAGGIKNGQWWGHLTYMDKAEDLRVKGDGVDSYENTPTPQGNRSVITGHGHLSDGRPVNYTVTVEDNGEPGRTDSFHIVLTGGRSYENRGVLGGGNLQFHDKPSRCPVN